MVGALQLHQFRSQKSIIQMRNIALPLRLYAPLTAAGLDYFVYSSTLAIYGRHGLFPLSGGATVREIAVSNILHISIAFCAERQIFTGIVISLGTVPFDHKATLV